MSDWSAPFVLFAQDAAPGGAGAGPSQSLFSFLPLVGIMVLFYLLLVRPQQKQEKARQAMIAALKHGDQVQTTGGLIGTIVGFKKEKDHVVLQVDDTGKTKMTFVRSSIVRLVEPDKEKSVD